MPTAETTAIVADDQRLLPARGSAGWLDRSFLTRMLGVLGCAREGACIIELPDGSRRLVGRGSATPVLLRVNRARTARRLFLNGEIGFGEAYMDGDWHSPDLAGFLQFALVNEKPMGTTGMGTALASTLFRVRHTLHRNSRDGSRRNIAQHYDLSNAFYREWLGDDMTYSSAKFEAPDEPLASAQRRKYRHLAGLLELKPGDRVLEIGCGWGSFALIAATEFGCRVTAITLSAQQCAWARRTLYEAGLADRIEVRLEDYRDVQGNFDKIASIEMFEAVGEAYWPLFFEILRDRLRPGGQAAMQVITIEEDRFATYRRRTDFIQRYIFPGGMLPTLRHIEAEAARAGLSLANVTPFGASYARTLKLWNKAFQNAWPTVARLGFDERFKRMWEFYLAYCEAGFRVGSIDVVQFRLTHA